MKFRKLRADEIECRVSQINEKGLTLLLYKDARVDMNMLDEAISPEHWQCHYEDHKGTLFCSVGILDSQTGLWVWKEDAGAPSNMESQKGEASDAFKRACFRWGIGRELYTAPFIWVPSAMYKSEQRNGKWTTYDRFEVSSIGYEGDSISQLTIIHQKTRKAVFSMGTHNSTPEAVKSPETENTTSEGHINDVHWQGLKVACKAAGISPEELLVKYQVAKPSDITMGLFRDMMDYLEKEGTR